MVQTNGEEKGRNASEEKGEKVIASHQSHCCHGSDKRGEKGKKLQRRKREKVIARQQSHCCHGSDKRGEKGEKLQRRKREKVIARHQSHCCHGSDKQGSNGEKMWRRKKGKSHSSSFKSLQVIVQTNRVATGRKRGERERRRTKNVKARQQNHCCHGLDK